MSILFPEHHIHLPEHIHTALANFYNKKNILVTGGVGFIGTYLIKKLCELGANVIIFDDFSHGTPDNNQELFKNIPLINDSILHDCAVARAFTNNSVDVVFHLAALRSVPESFQKPQEYYDVNTQGTLELLKACRSFNTQRFIFSSSAAVYGDYADTCDETIACNPTSPYGLSKLNAEKYCVLFAKHFGVDTVCLRYFNVYDDLCTTKTSLSSVHSVFNYAFKNNLPITIEGSGEQTRDFVPVSAIIDANLLFGMLAPQASGQLFNIATGHSISINTLITHMQKQFPEYNNTVSYVPERTGDVSCSRASVKKYHEFVEML